jgi:diketogulonate reductase-like aldo/keto reductase
LADQLRKNGQLPPIGGLLSSPKDPTLRLCDGRLIPSLAFGLYKVPAGAEGVKIISEAIQAGYRHFDTASLYNNEVELGQAIHQSGIPRQDFFICSKVWNDAQKEGPQAVLKSVESSLRNLCCGYIDVMYVHWPVPGHFIETYNVLQEVHMSGQVRNIGISNFGITEYEELMDADGITIKPAVNQIEISPLMYRAKTIQYFQDHGIIMVASKALHRVSGIDNGIVPSIAAKHSATSAQVLIRWGIQKGLVVVSKTSNPQRMAENRGVLDLRLLEEDIAKLDALTSEEEIRAREYLEIERRNGI